MMYQPGSPADVRRASIARCIAGVLLLVLLLCAGACKKAESDIHMVGKWKSTRLTTPIYLHANGEWEIKNDDGAVLQYGLWHVQDKKIIWSFKKGERMGREGDPILSAKQGEFKVREGDGSTTTFTQLE
jgi:hypothetical protein